MFEFIRTEREKPSSSLSLCCFWEGETHHSRQMMQKGSILNAHLYAERASCCAKTHFSCARQVSRSNLLWWRRLQLMTRAVRHEYCCGDTESQSVINSLCVACYYNCVLAATFSCYGTHAPTKVVCCLRCQRFYH